MKAANTMVIESNIPSADPATAKQFATGLSVKQRREMESINDWLEMQDEAEVDALTADMSGRNNRRFQLDEHANSYLQY